MKRIGILSDTHGFFNPALESFFAECDEIWHAGDWGADVVEKIERLKPVKGVYGNIDGQSIRKKFPEYLFFEIEGVKVFIIHIGGYPNYYSPYFKKLIKDFKPDLLICGHSHILRIMKDPINNWLLINPGACGNHGFQKVNTAVRLVFADGKMTNLEVWEQKRA